jgi:hypothetical protein
VGPLSLVSTVEELLGRKSSGPGLENLEYGRRDLSHAAHSIHKFGTDFADKRRSLAEFSRNGSMHQAAIVRRARIILLRLTGNRVLRQQN